MTTGSYLEHYLTLLAWVINNGIWSTLLSTGLFALALGAIIVSEWLDARAQGADEGNKGVLSILRVENRLYVAYLVILFACVPLLPLDITHLKFDSTRSKECGVNVAVAAPEQTGWGKAFDSIGEKSGHVPVWWALVHVISKGVTASATAAIPCYPDIRGAAMEIDETRIADKSLADELARFANDCYPRARDRLMASNVSLTPEQYLDTGWIGSKYFLETDGYYNKLQAEKPLKNWPYQKPRDSGYGEIKTGPMAGAGYPPCKKWWEDKGIGLRDRLLKTVEPDGWLRIKNAFGFTKDEEMHEQTLKQLVSPAHLNKTNSQGELYANTGSNSRKNAISASLIVPVAGTLENLTGLLVNMGAAIKSVSFYGGMKTLRIALPMIQAFLIMGIIICLPLIIVMSTYNLKVVMMTSFGLFTLHMLSFWWELASWLDSSLITQLYDKDITTISRFLKEPMDATLSAQVINMVMSAMFLLLPGLFFIAMSWAGYALGRGMDGMLSSGSNPARQAGETGGNIATSVGTSVATRGVVKTK